MTKDLCACGKPLHYSVPDIERVVSDLVAAHGPVVTITTPNGSWLVPRHYIALHGVKADELPKLAKKYGFERTE